MKYEGQHIPGHIRITGTTSENQEPNCGDVKRKIILAEIQEKADRRDIKQKPNKGTERK